MPDSPIAQVFPARLVLQAETRATAAQLTTLARQKALDPTIFDDERYTPFFWTAEISNSRLMRSETSTPPLSRGMFHSRP